MISIRYYLHNKAYKKGLHPLYMSVHPDGVARLQQAVGESISPKQWHQDNQKVTGIAMFYWRLFQAATVWLYNKLSYWQGVR